MVVWVVVVMVVVIVVVVVVAVVVVVVDVDADFVVVGWMINAHLTNIAELIFTNFLQPLCRHTPITVCLVFAPLVSPLLYFVSVNRTAYCDGTRTSRYSCAHHHPFR